MSEYYFLTFGNSFDGYPIYLNSDLNVQTTINPVFIHPNTNTTGLKSTLSLSQFEGPIIDLPIISISGEQIEALSGYFRDIETINENTLINVNGMIDAYVLHTIDNSEHILGPNSYINNKKLFILSSTIGLLKTSNYLPEYGSTRPGIEYNTPPSLLVDPDYYDLEIIESHTNNIDEWLEQFNVSFYNASMTSSYLAQWRQSGQTMNYPISNYANEIIDIQELYTFTYTYRSTPRYDCNITKAWIGLSSQIDFNYSCPIYNSDKIYLCTKGTEVSITIDTLIYKKTAYSAPSPLDITLNNFSLKSKSYILAKQGASTTYATLFKHDDHYLPISYTDNPPLSGLNVNVSIFGKFEIINQDYLVKQNSFFWISNNYRPKCYHYGEWLSGLQYIKEDNVNTEGYNFNIVEQNLSGNFRFYPSIIGFNLLGNNHELNKRGLIYDSTIILNSLHLNNDDIVYISIDPQSYSISL